MAEVFPQNVDGGLRRAPPRQSGASGDAAANHGPALHLKMKFCMYHLQGVCKYSGDTCAFAHSTEEMHKVRGPRRKKPVPKSGNAPASGMYNQNLSEFKEAQKNNEIKKDKLPSERSSSSSDGTGNDWNETPAHAKSEGLAPRSTDCASHTKPSASKNFGPLDGDAHGTVSDWPSLREPMFVKTARSDVPIELQPIPAQKELQCGGYWKPRKAEGGGDRGGINKNCILATDQINASNADVEKYLRALQVAQATHAAQAAQAAQAVQAAQAAQTAQAVRAAQAVHAMQAAQALQAQAAQAAQISQATSASQTASMGALPGLSPHPANAARAAALSALPSLTGQLEHTLAMARGGGFAVPLQDLQELNKSVETLNAVLGRLAGAGNLDSLAAFDSWSDTNAEDPSAWNHASAAMQNYKLVQPQTARLFEETAVAKGLSIPASKQTYAGFADQGLDQCYAYGPPGLVDVTAVRATRCAPSSFPGPCSTSRAIGA